MKTDNIYVGFIYLISDEQYLGNDAIRYKYQFVKTALIFQKKDYALSERFCDLKTGIIYKTTGCCFKHKGDLVVFLGDGILPFRQFYNEVYQEAKPLGDNITKRKVLKLYNDFQNNNCKKN